MGVLLLLTMTTQTTVLESWPRPGLGTHHTSAVVPVTVAAVHRDPVLNPCKRYMHGHGVASPLTEDASVLYSTSVRQTLQDTF